MATLVYTNIQHAFRREHGLSCLEYVLLDMVFHLENYKKSDIPGWCYMSREEMGAELGITKQGLIKMIDRLINDGFLVKNPKGKYLQTTPKWNPYTDGKQSLPNENIVVQDGKQSSMDSGKQSLPNNIYIDNNNKPNNNVGSATDEPPFSVFKNSDNIWICKVLRHKVGEFWKLNKGFLPETEFARFIANWSAVNRDKVPKWYRTKNFQLEAALATWKIDQEAKIPFDTFWDAYGLKESREKCVQLWNKLTPEIHQLIMDDLPKYFASLDWKKKKNPETYLKGKHWLDERTVTPVPTQAAPTPFKKPDNSVVPEEYRIQKI